MNKRRMKKHIPSEQNAINNPASQSPTQSQSTALTSVTNRLATDIISHTAHEELAFPYIKPAIFVCSGSSESSINAHSMQQYLRGLTYAAQTQVKEVKSGSKRSSPRRAKSACASNESTSTSTSVEQRDCAGTEGVSAVPSVAILENQEITFLNPPTVLALRMNNNTALSLDLTPSDGCFSFNDLGYGKYIC